MRGREGMRGKGGGEDREGWGREGIGMRGKGGDRDEGEGRGRG